MYFLLEMVIFQPAMLVYQRVTGFLEPTLSLSVGLVNIGPTKLSTAPMGPQGSMEVIGRGNFTMTPDQMVKDRGNMGDMGLGNQKNGGIF